MHLLRGNELHRPANVPVLHSIDPNQLGRASRACQVDLGLPITKHVHMRRLVVVQEDDDAETPGAMDGDHGDFSPP